MGQFKIGDVYEHTGKTYTIVGRTSKTVRVSSNGLKAKSHKIVTDSEGNESAMVDCGHRTIKAFMK